jgi:single-strand DNA-binding protein
MPSLNKVMLMGNLTRDPELRYTPKGQAVTDVGLAVNRKYKVENEMREEVTFVDVTFWGKQAEVVCQWMKKGRPLFVEGRLQMDTWDDKQTGKKMYKMRVIGEDFQFLGGKDSGSGGGGGSSASDSGDYDEPRGSRPPQQRSGGQGPAASRESNAFPPGLDDEDEIPF